MSWTTAPLNEISDVIRGVTFSKSDAVNTPGPGLVPVLRAGNISDTLDTSGGLVFVDEARVSTKQRLQPEDIVVCTSSGSATVLGKSALLEYEWEGTFGAFLATVRTDKSVADPRFVSHYLRSPLFRKWASNSAGIGIKNIRASDFKQVKIPLPPLEEQKRIAGILDQADALRRLRTRALEKLNALGQAIFHEMFVERSDPSWSDFLVDELVTNARTGPFGSQLLVSEFVEKGIPVLGIDNVVQNKFVWAKERFITEEKYEDLKRYTVLPGDVLITIMGTCGRCAVVPDEMPTAINTKHICCLTLDRKLIEPKFLQSAFLRHPSVLKQLGVQAKGAVMPGLNMGIIKGLTLQVPPIDLQLEYVRKLNQATVEISNQNSSLRQIEILFASLQHRAFRGEL